MLFKCLFKCPLDITESEASCQHKTRINIRKCT